MARTRVRLFLAQSTPGSACFIVIPARGCCGRLDAAGFGCGSKKTLIKTTESKSDTRIVARLARFSSLLGRLGASISISSVTGFALPRVCAPVQSCQWQLHDTVCYSLSDCATTIRGGRCMEEPSEVPGETRRAGISALVSHLFNAQMEIGEKRLSFFQAKLSQA